MTDTDTTQRQSHREMSREKTNNRILPGTRWTAILIIPFLLTAWVLLYLFPGETETLFAWPINPEMSARLMGAGYLAGAYFFIRVAIAKRWHTVQAGFLPVALFAAWMAMATFVHWDRFTHGHVSFITWVTVYAITPILVLVVWLRNRRSDPRTFAEQDAHVPNWARRIMGSIGSLMILFAIFFYLRPDWMIAFWPWTLSPLTTRTILGFFLIPAATFVTMALEPRWSAHRVVVQGQIIGLALIMIASALSWGDFFPANPAAWVFVASGIVVLLVLFEYYRMMETRVEERPK
jgi:hypothetical protein